ncbi:MAG: Helix-turn-helix motif protein [candidate division WS6 bacterium OLB20]|uniref:Helix-turn-helix motif protein n=1 Tax=candidate division WS6 bacterium OLB20 TaxID=1617426 RepID=A0A136LYQ2_9BACT|nr:MAG: Helix-turn-helix motif protein [candidate division WS6 bacterium OLB20]
MSESVGDKIRTYRKRAGVSQLDLEMAIGASPGSLSRIENGVNNPTKETILKIADHLSLSDLELGDLFGIVFDTPSKLLNIINNLEGILNTDELLQYAVDEVAKVLGFSIVVLLLVDGDRLRVSAFSRTNLALITIGRLGKNLTSLSVSLTEHPDNYLVRVVKEKKKYYSDYNYNFTVGAMSRNFTELMQKFSKSRYSAGLPILYEAKVYGAVYFTHLEKRTFDAEMPLMEEFVSQIGRQLALKFCQASPPADAAPSDR